MSIFSQIDMINFSKLFCTLGTFISGRYNFRNITSLREIEKHENVRKMSGWQIHAYGDLHELVFSNNIKMPILRGSNDVLVKVHAASVNPIDVAMLNGYGSKALCLLRSSDSVEFPLIFGRDFCGTIVHKGMTVRQSLKVGDKVFGVVPLHRAGCHSEYVVVDANCLIHKPVDMNDIDSAAILYTGLTAWSGLFISGALGGVRGALSALGGGYGKRVCILGASGGVGHMAVQIAKAENVEVIATCASDAVSLVKIFGADYIIDYTHETALNDLVKNGPYDIVLDCANKGTSYALDVPWKFHHYVTFNSPLLSNIDNYGFGIGTIRNIMDLTQSNLSKHGGGLVNWGYFLPLPHAIDYLLKLIRQRKLVPHIEAIFDFKNTNEAYKRVSNKHLRGKILLQLSHNINN